MRKPVLTASFLQGLTQQERSGTALEEGQPHIFDYSALLGPNFS